MSETVSIKSFKPGNDWTSEDGKIALTFYECVFDRNGADFTATWNKKQGTGDPPIGEQIEGEFTEKKPGDWRFRKASKPQGGGPGSAGSFNSRPGKSPDETASIHRQVALKVCASRICEVGLTNDVRTLIESVERFIGEAASEGGGHPTPQGSSTPAPSQKPATHEDFHGLLETAGLNTNAARVVTDFAMTNMSAEEQDAALGMLRNEDRAAAAVNRLSDKAEAHYGSPLPSADSDDSIPF